MANGIDVSQWQGDIDWDKVVTDFVVIRAGYGRELSQKDRYFEANYSGAKANCIPCGAYWYSYAVTPEEARLEANVCLEIIKGKQFEYPIYFDIEEKRQLDLGREKCSAIARAFLETVEKAGYFVGIYSSRNTLVGYIDEDIRRRYTVWVADYKSGRPDYSGAYGMWQKSSTGRINGISGNVDLDESFQDFPAAIISAGLNGFPKQIVKRTLNIEALTIGGVTYSGELTEK